MKTMLVVLKEITGMLVPATDFYNGLTSYQNLQTEITTWPAVYVNEPIVSDHEISASNNFETTYPLVILFGDLTRLEDTQEEHDVIIYEQRRKAEEFIKLLLAYEDEIDLKYVDEITSIKMTNIINVTSHNFSGIQLEMSVRINPQSRLC